MHDSRSDVNKDEVTVGLWLTVFPLVLQFCWVQEGILLTELLQHRRKGFRRSCNYIKYTNNSYNA